MPESASRCVWNIGPSYYIPCDEPAWTERVVGHWEGKKWVRLRIPVGSYALTGPWPGPRCDEHQWEGVAEHVEASDD